LAEDPFADLGGRRPGRSASERLADLDETDPDRPGARPPTPRRPRSRYAWVLGVAFTVVVILAGVNAVRTGDGSLRGLPPGTTAPVFAAPAAGGRLDGDANVSQVATDVDGSRRRPACAVRGPGIVNLCELRREPLVLTFVVPRGTDGAGQLDLIERARRRTPGVRFAVVVSGEPRAEVAALLRRRRLGYPVAVDPDGAVVNLYRVGVCPTTSFIARGGRVRETKLGALSENELARAGRRLLARP
jgi:hypothetical protein